MLGFAAVSSSSITRRCASRRTGSLIDVSLSISPVRDHAGRIVGASKIARDITARRQAEDALAAANAKFASVFNQSGIFAGILDTEGTVRDVNALALEACGYTLDEVIGLPFWETPWWRDSEHAKARIRLAVRTGVGGRGFCGNVAVLPGRRQRARRRVRDASNRGRRGRCPLLASDGDRHHRSGGS